MNDLSEEKQEQIIRGFDLVLSAVGAPTMSELMQQQVAAIGSLPAEQQNVIIKAMKEGVTGTVAGSAGMAVTKMMEQLQNPEALAKLKEVYEKQASTLEAMSKAEQE